MWFLVIFNVIFLLGLWNVTPAIFWDVKNDILTSITETSNDENDNDWSDDCDYNFGTFDDFGVRDYHKEYT